jgi:hypothetical protein
LHAQRRGPIATISHKSIHMHIKIQCSLMQQMAKQMAQPNKLKFCEMSESFVLSHFADTSSQVPVFPYVIFLKNENVKQFVQA